MKLVDPRSSLIVADPNGQSVVLTHLRPLIKTLFQGFDLGAVPVGKLSNDGIHFREPQPDFELLHRGEKGSWESQALLQGNGFETVGDKTYMWYGGWDDDVTLATGHAQVGLATLRRDGFGSLSPIKLPDLPNKYPFYPLNIDSPAAFITCSIKVNGTGKVWINADGLSDEAKLRVELVDEAENPLPDFSGENSIPLVRSGVRLPVAWKNNTELRNLPVPFNVKVSFEGKQRQSIKFYAMYITK